MFLGVACVTALNVHYPNVFGEIHLYPENLQALLSYDTHQKDVPHLADRKVYKHILDPSYDESKQMRKHRRWMFLDEWDVLERRFQKPKAKTAARCVPVLDADSSSDSSSSSSISTSSSSSSDSKGGEKGSEGGKPDALAPVAKPVAKPVPKVDDTQQPAASSFHVRDPSAVFFYGSNRITPRWKDGEISGFQISCNIAAHNIQGGKNVQKKSAWRWQVAPRTELFVCSRPGWFMACSRWRGKPT